MAASCPDLAPSAALDARQRFQLSYWDAEIIEASRAMGCTQVRSEDLSDGQDYGGVRVANPFRRETLNTVGPARLTPHRRHIELATLGQRTPGSDARQADPGLE